MRVHLSGDTLTGAEQTRALLEKTGIHPTHPDARFIKPPDESICLKIFHTHRYVVAVQKAGIAHS